MIRNKQNQVLISSFDGVSPENARTPFGKRLAKKHLMKYLSGADMFTYLRRPYFVKRTLKWGVVI